MQVLARLVADELAFREAAPRLRRMEAQAAGAEALLAALHARDGYTGEHSTAVVELATDVIGGATSVSGAESTTWFAGHGALGIVRAPTSAFESLGPSRYSFGIGGAWSWFAAVTGLQL